MALKRLLRHSRPEDFDAIREVAELYLVLVASTSGVEQMFTQVLRASVFGPALQIRIAIVTSRVLGLSGAQLSARICCY